MTVKQQISFLKSCYLLDESARHGVMQLFAEEIEVVFFLQHNINISGSIADSTIYVGGKGIKRGEMSNGQAAGLRIFTTDATRPQT